MSLAPWPGFRALALVFAWILGVFVVFAWRAYWTLPQVAEEGVAAVSFDVIRPALVAFGAPLLFFAAYALFRRRSGRNPAG
jgi:putative flippase GtrA